MTKILKDTLREAAFQIRTTQSLDTIKTIIKETMEKVYNVLVIFLGEPPQKFVWEYMKKKSFKSSKKANKNGRKKKSKSKKGRGKKGGAGVFRRIGEITPQEFFKKYVPFNREDYVVLIDYPSKKRNELYNVKYSNQILDGSQNSYLNVPIENDLPSFKFYSNGLEMNSAFIFIFLVGEQLPPYPHQPVIIGGNRIVPGYTRVWAKKKHKMITGPELPDNIQTELSMSSLIALNSTHFVIVCYRTEFNGNRENYAIIRWPQLTSSKLPSFNINAGKVDRCVVAIGFGKVAHTKSIYTACHITFPSIDSMFSLKLLSYDIEKGMDEEWTVIANWSFHDTDAVGKHSLKTSKN